MMFVQTSALCPQSDSGPLPASCLQPRPDLADGASGNGGRPSARQSRAIVPGAGGMYGAKQKTVSCEIH